jgi:hypothetical protein
MPTRKITRVYKQATRGNPHAQEVEAANLLNFMTIIQRTKVSLLPISPHKALGALGRGLSGSIQQATADVATVFAFKEGVPDKTLRDSNDTQDWYSLITEITILQHKWVRNSHRFADLVGVSFYVQSSPSRRAWPLIVTSRANRGDLAAFLSNQEPQSLTDAIRRLLFAEVLEAIYILRECGNIFPVDDVDRMPAYRLQVLLMVISKPRTSSSSSLRKAN